jgi:hypothetical protein
MVQIPSNGPADNGNAPDFLTNGNGKRANVSGHFAVMPMVPLDEQVGI